MLALGIILVLLAAGAAVAAVFGGTGSSTVFDLGVVEIQTNTLGAFLLGAATVLVLVIGLGLIRAGAARARRRRQERKELKTLHKKLEREGSGSPTGAAGTAAAPTDASRTGGTHADPAVPHDTSGPSASNPPR